MLILILIIITITNSCILFVFNVHILLFSTSLDLGGGDIDVGPPGFHFVISSCYVATMRCRVGGSALLKIKTPDYKMVEIIPGSSILSPSNPAGRDIIKLTLNETRDFSSEHLGQFFAMSPYPAVACIRTVLDLSGGNPLSSSKSRLTSRYHWSSSGLVKNI